MMVKRAIFALGCGAFAGAAEPSVAGDAATLSVLGFSADGKVFAFEEHGVQDGSGFPYANRFYIDTATDSFLPGGSIRVRIDDEAAGVLAARNQAKSQGEAATGIGDAALAANPGNVVVQNPITELSAPFDLATFLPRPVFPPIDAQVLARLEQVDFDPQPPCEGMTDVVSGFKLTLEVDDVVRTLHEDRSVPKSRTCPQGYRFGEIRTFYPEGAAPVIAIVLSMEGLGFEGPDHRWLAVTSPLNP